MYPEQQLSSQVLKDLDVTRIVVAFGDELKDDLFVEKLSRYSVKDIIRTGKERRAGSVGYAEAMLLVYKQRLRLPLKIDKLYIQPEDRDMVTADNNQNDLLGLIDPP